MTMTGHKLKWVEMGPDNDRFCTVKWCSSGRNEFQLFKWLSALWMLLTYLNPGRNLHVLNASFKDPQIPVPPQTPQTPLSVLIILETGRQCPIRTGDAICLMARTITSPSNMSYSKRFIIFQGTTTSSWSSLSLPASSLGLCYINCGT